MSASRSCTEKATKREPIQLTDNILESVMKLSEGNPGAVTAIASLMKGDPTGFIWALHLDDMGMRGSQIWVAFSDYCERDVEKFRQAIRDRDPAMVALVNERCPEHRAVARGASFR